QEDGGVEAEAADDAPERACRPTTRGPLLLHYRRSPRMMAEARRACPPGPPSVISLQLAARIVLGNDGRDRLHVGEREERTGCPRTRPVGCRRGGHSRAASRAPRAELAPRPCA